MQLGRKNKYFAKKPLPFLLYSDLFFNFVPTTIEYDVNSAIYEYRQYRHGKMALADCRTFVPVPLCGYLSSVEGWQGTEDRTEGD